MEEKKTATSRKIDYAVKVPSNIWLEEACEENAYINEALYCNGYPLEELASKRSFADVLYLLLRGELPSSQQRDFLNTLLIAFITPGPRHPAARAASASGLGKTMVGNILPVALSVLSGDRNGAGDVEAAMRFIVKSRRKDVAMLREHDELFGFGQLYGGYDRWSEKLLCMLIGMPEAGDCMHWAVALHDELKQDNKGILPTGLFAAAACDLGFRPSQGLVLYQLANAPGLAAQGLEFSTKPLNSMPFVSDEDYFFDVE